MAQDLSGLYISQSFQNLVQRSASGAFNVLATATGTEFIPISASYAISASQAQSVVSASYAVSASFAQRAISSSHSDVNLQEVLQNGNSASIAINLTASLNTTGSLTEHKNEFKVTAQDKDTDFDVAAFKIKNNGAGKTIITGSVEITGSSSVEGISTVSLNSSGNSPKLIIKDDANDSFSVGPTIRFTGSKVGLIETEKNLQFDVGSTGDTIFNAGRQYLFTKDNFQSGDFKITDNGSRSTLYKHENLTETGSIRFANTTTDAGIAIRMDDNKMALQMYSGSSFVPIIQRASGSKQVNLYDSTSSTGSSAQVLTSNANGGIEWAAGGGGGAAFPFTGSAQITGSLGVTGSTKVTGDVNITGSIIGSGNIRAGQAAGAFASDSIELGSATVPVQYGNMVVHTNTTRDLGNQYNAFQILDAGAQTLQFASTAFSGLGNNVHLLGMGGNSTGRADNIKMWSSGSGAELNLSTDVVIQSGNKLTMSGSIELASSTGSVGQVIGVDAGGKAKWETPSGGGGGITSIQLSPATSSYTQATAPGCDYVFQTASIAGGTFTVGDVLEIRMMTEQTGGSGTTYITTNMFEGNVSPGDPYPSGTDFQLGGSQSSGNGKVYYQKTLWIQSATRTAVYTPGDSNETHALGVSGGDPVEIRAIDWTQDQTWWYGACIDNAGHTLENFGGIIRKLNG